MKKSIDNLNEKYYTNKDKTETAFKKVSDLKNKKSSGSVTLHVHQGSVQKVEVKEFF